MEPRRRALCLKLNSDSDSEVIPPFSKRENHEASWRAGGRPVQPVTPSPVHLGLGKTQWLTWMVTVLRYSLACYSLNLCMISYWWCLSSNWQYSGCIWIHIRIQRSWTVKHKFMTRTMMTRNESDGTSIYQFMSLAWNYIWIHHDDYKIVSEYIFMCACVYVCVHVFIQVNPENLWHFVLMFSENV